MSFTSMSFKVMNVIHKSKKLKKWELRSHNGNSMCYNTDIRK